jgi:hypothetical protein
LGERLTSALATTERPGIDCPPSRRPKPKGTTRPEAGPAEVQALSREPWLDGWVECMPGIFARAWDGTLDLAPEISEPDT